jgi:hypothetical protein
MRTSDQICANTLSLVAVLIVISRREVELVQLREQRWQSKRTQLALTGSVWKEFAAAHFAGAVGATEENGG